MKKFAVLGYPIKHSRSPQLFLDLAKKHQVKLQYDILEIAPEDFLNEQHFLKEYDGFNITSPYKQKILEFTDTQSFEVEELRACNVIRNDGGSLSAFNTDVYGFKKSMEKLNYNVDQTVLILGSGGAGRAVELALRQMTFQKIYFHSRRFLHNLKNFEPQIIINATILGMNDNYNPEDLKFFDLPWNSVQIAYDLIYVPQETIFMKMAREKGVGQIQGGMDMLYHQAEKSFQLWFGENK